MRRWVTVCPAPGWRFWAPGNRLSVAVVRPELATARMSGLERRAAGESLPGRGAGEVRLDELRAVLGVDEPGAMRSGDFVKRRVGDLVDRRPGAARGEVRSVCAPDEHGGY